VVAKDELGQAGQHVTIGAHRDGDAGVAEAFADDLGRDPGRQGGRDPGRQGGRRVAMADVMQANPREPGGAACCSNHLENRPGPRLLVHGIWLDRSFSLS
jgi:hypothetical protein